MYRIFCSKDKVVGIKKNYCYLKKTTYFKLRNLVLLFVWEDARVWAHWNLFFDMHLSCLGLVSCVFTFWVSSGCTVGGSCEAPLPIGYSSSRGSSRLRDWTHVSCIPCITGRVFTAEPLGILSLLLKVHHRKWLLAGRVSIPSSPRVHHPDGCNVMAWWLQHSLFANMEGSIFYLQYKCKTEIPFLDLNEEESV